jgi:hypothetical protein
LAWAKLHGLAADEQSPPPEGDTYRVVAAGALPAPASSTPTATAIAATQRIPSLLSALTVHPNNAPGVPELRGSVGDAVPGAEC